jgi:tetratricopeptide (TPR) repeat protein
MAKDSSEGVLLSKQAFDLAEAGRLEEAAETYAEAARQLDPAHYWSPNNHGEYASVLVRLGRNDEALHQYEIALEQEQRLYAGDAVAAPVVAARYFLAEHLLRLGQPKRALQTIAPVLNMGTRQEALARTIEATALFAMGAVQEARKAAGVALQCATSEKQRSTIREKLANVLNS